MTWPKREKPETKKRLIQLIILNVMIIESCKMKTVLSLSARNTIRSGLKEVI